MNDCYFENIEELAQFCAELTRQSIRFAVEPASTAGRYLVRISGF